MTEHFTLIELTYSSRAKALKIDNHPPIDIASKLHFTAAGLERVRAALGYPILIHSGYRCAELNKAVGGVTDNPNTPEVEQSQHEKGEAVDFTCPKFGSPEKVAKALLGSMKMLGIDQMILEGTWLHLSFTLNPRYQVLTLKNGKYEKGLVG